MSEWCGYRHRSREKILQRPTSGCFITRYEVWRVHHTELPPTPSWWESKQRSGALLSLLHCANDSHFQCCRYLLIIMKTGRDRRRNAFHSLILLLSAFSWRQSPAAAFLSHCSTWHSGTQTLLSFPASPSPFHLSSSNSLSGQRHFISFRQSGTRLLQADTASDAESKGSSADEIILDKERALGILVLLSVPLSWGTYGPVVRYLYELQPPVPGFVFSATYYLVASLSLSTLSTLSNRTDKSTSTDTKISLPFLGGLELGGYLFFANGLQILGLKTVPADRAGFLVQLTTVMVPVVSAAFAGNLQSIPRPTWAACLLAFAGVIIMGLDGKEALLNDNGGIMSYLSSSLTTFTQGDLLIVFAAFVYTLHVVRLGKYAKETTPLKLAACKATTEAILSIGLVAVLMTVGGMAGDCSGILAYAQEMGRQIFTFFSTIFDGITSGAVPTSALVPAIGATLWTGLVTCAYTIYAQSYGQARVNPTEANLIYTIQPIFTALFAWGLLGETLGPAGFVGAAFIGAAVYTVAIMTSTQWEMRFATTFFVKSLPISSERRNLLLPLFYANQAQWMEQGWFVLCTVRMNDERCVETRNKGRNL